MGFYTKIKCPLYGIQDEKEVDEMTQKRLTAMPIKDTILTAQHSTAQHSTAQHSTAQHSTAQHSTAWANCALFVPCEAFETEYYIRDG